MRGAYTQPHPQEGQPPIEAGFCHKTPPTVSADLSSASHRPVRLVGWCGEWRWKLSRWILSGAAVGIVVSMVLLWGK
jgi:hypothetical protein